MEAQRLVAQAPSDHLFESDKSAPAQEENVGCVNWEKLLVRMLAASLRWNVGDSPFKNLQKRLLHALAGHIARDRRVLILAANLVDLVDVNDALLRAFDVAVRCLQ